VTVIVLVVQIFTLLVPSASVPGSVSYSKILSADFAARKYLNRIVQKIKIDKPRNYEFMVPKK
jgi:hypothetical protein